MVLDAILSWFKVSEPSWDGAEAMLSERTRFAKTPASPVHLKAMLAPPASWSRIQHLLHFSTTSCAWSPLASCMDPWSACSSPSYPWLQHILTQKPGKFKKCIGKHNTPCLEPSRDFLKALKFLTPAHDLRPPHCLLIWPLGSSHDGCFSVSWACLNISNLRAFAFATPLSAPFLISVLCIFLPLTCIF